MKMTVDIPEKELADAMRFIGAKTKRQAILAALQEFNRKHRMRRLIRFSGTCDFDRHANTERQEASLLSGS